MSDTTSKRPLSRAQHLAGTGMLLLALLLLGGVSLLPTRGAAGIDLPFLDPSQPPVVVAFAGYPGCGTVCPVSLSLMREAYRALPPARQPRIGLQFVNIRRNADPVQTARFARAWHPDFRAYAVTAADAPSLYAGLALQSFGSSEAAEAHSGFIYIFVREAGAWRIEHVYRQLPAAAELLARLTHLAIEA